MSNENTENLTVSKMSKSTTEVVVENGIGLSALYGIGTGSPSLFMNLAVGAVGAYALNWMSPSTAQSFSDPMLGVGLGYYAGSVSGMDANMTLMMAGGGGIAAYAFRSQIDQALSGM